MVERLDEELEGLMDGMVGTAIEARDSLAWPDPISRIEHEASRDAVRLRIQLLIENARTEGFSKGSLMTGRGMLGFNLDGSNVR